MNLMTAFRRYRHALDSVDDARLDLEEAIRASIAERGLSQSEVARLLGWPRQRVQKVVRRETDDGA